MNTKPSIWALRLCLYSCVGLCLYLCVLFSAGFGAEGTERGSGYFGWLFPAEREVVAPKPVPAPAEFQPDARMIAEARRAEVDGMRRALAVTRGKEMAALRADLATPWTSLILAFRADCSCTGTYLMGFRIRREGGSLTVAPWSGGGLDPEKLHDRTGDARPLTQPELEKVLSEAALFYLAASLSMTPVEQAGTFPREGSEAEKMEWRLRYRAAGGDVPLGDQSWIFVRVATPAGLKVYKNRWDGNDCGEFVQWAGAFGTLPPP